jgi:DNA-binding transcriptional ArsR family regulator
MAITHPTIEQLDLPNVLSALGDATRLAMVHRLAERDEIACGAFQGLASKTVLSYHMAKLREAGLIHVRAQSTRRFVSLRRADLEAKFPGLLATVLPRPSLPSPAGSAFASASTAAVASAAAAFAASAGSPGIVTAKTDDRLDDWID